MGTMTGQMLVGMAHQNDSGILPTHVLYLFENNRPVVQVFSKNIDIMKLELYAIPTVEKMLEDMLLIVSGFVLKDKRIKSELESILELGPEGQKIIEFYELDEEKRQELYKYNQQFLKDKKQVKVTTCIYYYCHLMEQIERIKEYGISYEICKATYLKEYSAWIRDFEVKEG